MGTTKDSTHKQLTEMVAIGKGKYRTIVEAPKGATKHELEKKARKYIRGTFTVKS